MSPTEAKARLFEIEQESRGHLDTLTKAARLVREAVLENTGISAPDFETYNAGLMLDKVALLAAQGIRARDALRALAAERDRLTAYLETLKGE
jgi:hypothetical protein